MADHDASRSTRRAHRDGLVNTESIIAGDVSDDRASNIVEQTIRRLCLRQRQPVRSSGELASLFIYMPYDRERLECSSVSECCDYSAKPGGSSCGLFWSLYASTMHRRYGRHPKHSSWSGQVCYQEE